MLKFTSSGLTEQAPANGYWVTFGVEGVALKMVRGSP